MKQYEDELARKRMMAEHELQRQRNAESVKLQEDAHARQEGERRRIEQQIPAERRAAEQYAVGEGGRGVGEGNQGRCSARSVGRRREVGSGWHGVLWVGFCLVGGWGQQRAGCIKKSQGGGGEEAQLSICVSDKDHFKRD